MAKINAPTNAGKKVNELIINQRLSADDAVRRILGPINRSALPEGSVIIGESLNELQYRDPQGFVHTLRRDGDATSPTFGQVQTLTDRPAVLPLTQQIPGLDAALQSAIRAISGGGLAPLSAADEESFAAIDKAERDLITEESEKAGGQLVASLYGRGMNESSLANDSAAAFTKALGIALGNQAAGSAQRRLSTRQFTTQSLMDLIASITGQETTRAGTSAQVGLGDRQLRQSGDEAARNFMLEWEKFNASQNKSKLPGILAAAASIGLAPFTGGTSLLGLAGTGLSGLLKRGSGRDPASGE